MQDRPCSGRRVIMSIAQQVKGRALSSSSADFHPFLIDDIILLLDGQRSFYNDSPSIILWLVTFCSVKQTNYIIIKITN